MSAADVKVFLETARETPWYALFSLMITTGVRPGEALGLKWNDVDFEQGRIHVQRTLTRGKDGWKLLEPKTARGRRVIPLPKSVVEDLRNHRKEQFQSRNTKEYENHDFVFAIDNGQPLHSGNIARRHFKPTLKKAGLPSTIRMYDLRHTCATLLLMAGENPKIVSERLGHASVTLTLDTYSHVLPDMQQGAADKLEKMLFKS